MPLCALRRSAVELLIPIGLQRRVTWHPAVVDPEESAEGIEVVYLPDDEHLGQLRVRARWAGFEGVGQAWVNRRHVSEFAEALGQYPLDEDSPVVFSAGLGDVQDYIEFIGLEAAPVGGKGQVVMTVRLAAEEWRNSEPVASNCVVIEFPTSYEYLRRFSGNLHLALDGSADQARLDFDVLL